MTELKVDTIPSLQITPAELKEIHTKGVELGLPSGLNAFIRPVTTRDLLRTLGRIPDELTNLVHTLVNPVDPELTASILDSMNQLTPEVIEMQFEFLDAYCKIAFVSPKVVDNPQDGANEISPDWLSSEDKGFVLALINAPAIRLREFRQFQTELDPSVEFESGLPPATEPDLPDSGTS